MKKIIYLLFLFLLTACTSAKEISQQIETNNKNPNIIVYYFHTTQRCSSCIKIEKYTKEALQESFAKEIEKGIIELKVLNTDEKPNKHYIKDYNLYTKSIIISVLSKGKETKWGNLEKIWFYLNDEKEFKNYIKTEIKKNI